MANASNAYATVRPIQSNIGDTIRGIEEMDFAYRKEQRDIEAQRKAEKEKQDKKKDELRQRILDKIPQNYDTGSSSLNEFQATLIQKAVDRKGEIFEQLNNPNLSERDRIKLEIENQNLDNLPSNLKIATDNFSETIKMYKEGVADGSLFADADFEKKVLSGFENYYGDLDNGLPVVGFADKNEDGSINGLDVVPYDQLQQGIGNWSFQKQIDLQKIANGLSEEIGYEDITTDNGFTSVRTKTPNEKSILTVATNALKNPDGSYTDTALSEMRKMGVQPSEESFKLVENRLHEMIKAKLEKIVDKDVDAGAILANKKYNDDKKKEELEVTTVNLSNTALGNDSFGGKPISKSNKYEKGLNLGKGIKFETIGGAKTGLDNSTVTNLFLTKDNEIVFTANVLDKKAVRSTSSNGYDINSGEENTTSPASYRTETRKATGATAAYIANKLGYNNEQELKDYIRSLNKSGKTEAEDLGL